MNPAPQQQPPQPPQPFQAQTGDAARAAAARKRTVSAMLTSLAIHALLLVAAASLTIMIIAPKPKMMFEGKKSPSLPARKLEHAIRVQQMKKQTRKPQILQRLVTEAPSKVALPEMPQMKTPDIKDMRDTPLVNSRAGSIGGIGSGGGGAGRGLGGGTGYSDTKFFGENVRSRSICICIDVTKSMVQAKQVVADTLDQAKIMMEKMNVSTKFNLMVFRDGCDSFSPQMVYATKENAEKGFAWLTEAAAAEKGNAPGVGNTPFFSIKRAVEMGAETIFVLSDDKPYLESNANHPDEMMDYVKNIVRAAGKPVKVNVILFKPNISRSGLESQEYYTDLAKQTGGRCTIWPSERKQELKQLAISLRNSASR